MRTQALLFVVSMVTFSAAMAAENGMPMNIQIKELPGQSTLVIKKSAKAEELGEALGAILPKVAQFLRSKKVDPLGPPFTRFLKNENGVFEFEAGFTVPAKTVGEGEIVASTLPAGSAAVTSHFGPYYTISKTVETIKKFIAESKREIAGPSWEVYISDPATVKPEDIQTDVYIPVK